MHKRTIVVLLCLLVLSSLAVGQIKTIKFKDGGSITGTVKKVKDGYEVTKSNGITVEVLLNKVASIKDVADPTNEYLEKLKEINANDADARYKLGEWAFRKGMYRIAKSELEAAKKLRKDFERADLLLTQVMAGIVATSPKTTGTVKLKTPTSRPAGKKNMVSLRDINRIKISEVKKGEKVKVAFRKRVLDRFIDSMRSSDDFRDDLGFERKFRRRKSYLQLDYILDNVSQNAWALKDDIIVRNDPKVFNEFRRKIWPMLTKSCGSILCHGAKKGQGKLQLFGRALTDDTAIYTNFLTLDMYTKGRNRMIYRDHVELSLLLEYGLHRDDARMRHPKKIQPLYKSVSDPKYKMMKEWIGSLRGPPHPKYGTAFKPSRGAKTSPKSPKNIPGATIQPVPKKTASSARPI